jgi:arylsulfatase A-like enzyme
MLYDSQMRITLLLVAALALVVFAPETTAATQPNFIIINCDDLGYNDIGPFGSKKHRTPNLDRMAREGRKFTSHYSSCGVCTPSRASLMTGCYPRRINLHENEVGGWVLFPGNKKGLNPTEITIAEVLKGAGYATAIIGKWHLGDQPEFLPTRQGFDYYFGIPFSNDMGHDSRPKPYRYPPLPLLRMEQVIEEEPDQRQITRRYTEEAIQWLRHTQEKKHPFLLNLPHTMPHWPQYSSKRFSGKSKNGKWGDTVEEIDWSVGELLRTLKELKIDQNTLVLFTSDNGGATQHGASNLPLKGGKGSTFEGGQRVPLLVRWPGRIDPGTTSAEMTTMMDILPTFADLAGARLDEDRRIDGRNIWSLMKSGSMARTPHKAFYYYFKGELHALRSGDWKLRVKDRAPRRQNKNQAAPRQRFPQLFDLGRDLAESRNVAGEHPDVVARLQSLLEIARVDLGDGDREGENTRPAGFKQNAKTLTQND